MPDRLVDALTNACWELPQPGDASLHVLRELFAKRSAFQEALEIDPSARGSIGRIPFDRLCGLARELQAYADDMTPAQAARFFLGEALKLTPPALRGALNGASGAGPDAEHPRPPE